MRSRGGTVSTSRRDAAREPLRPRRSGRARRPGRAGSVVALGLGALVLGATPAGAQSFGPSGCCFYADNSNHTYYNNVLTLGSEAAMDFAMLTRLESTDMTTDKFASWNNDTDVVAYDTTYSNEAWWGLWTCEVLVAGSATDCNRGTLRLNLRFGTPTTAVTCHEVGHSVGLDHSTLTTSCMQAGAGVANDYDTHDRSHINGHY
jgi:hypothetical protein